MHSNACDKPFDFCGSCPHNKNDSPALRRTKFIVNDGNNDERRLIELTDDQVRFLKWLQNNNMLWDEVSFKSVSVAEWEEI